MKYNIKYCRLGAVHDGSPPPSYLGGPGAEKCRWEDGYIMSDLRHTEKGFKWSHCSVSSFHHFLKYGFIHYNFFWGIFLKTIKSYIKFINKKKIIISKCYNNTIYIFDFVNISLYVKKIWNNYWILFQRWYSHLFIQRTPRGRSSS